MRDGLRYQLQPVVRQSEDQAQAVGIIFRQPYLLHGRFREQWDI
jgi:hypothetical protein